MRGKGLGKERRVKGFSLLEISIVLLIAGLLGQLFLVPMGQYMESENRKMTLQQLKLARTAVMGFVAAHGRFPCPASLAGPAIEVDDCLSTALVGAIPAATLGLGGTRNGDGLPVDAWGRILRYAVSPADHAKRGNPGLADMLTSGEMAEVGMRYLEPDLEICSISGSGQCAERHLLANQIPAVFFSLGRDPSSAGSQEENQDNDRTFLSRDYSRLEGAEFDDLVIWISENVLFFRLLQAGVLP